MAVDAHHPSGEELPPPLRRPRSGEYVAADGSTYQVSLDDCDREPIHVPNLIQPHGCLLAVGDDAAGEVLQASANAADLLGVAPLGRPLAEVVGPAVASAIGPGQGVASRQGPTLVGRIEPAGARFDVLAHRLGDANGEQVIVELEGVVDADEPGRPQREPLDEMRLMLAAMEATADLDDLGVAVAGQVQAITGFDRVMVYRFDADCNGSVVAEVMAPGREGQLESFVGLHYPASDIPAQARRLYLQNWTRQIGDVAYAPVPLEPSQNPRLAPGRRLDLSHAALRSVSPLHVEYLRNMGVTATLTVSLVDQRRDTPRDQRPGAAVTGQLWGLIACHHYAGPRRLSYARRSACELVGRAASLQITTRRARMAGEDLARRRSIQARLVRRTAGPGAADPVDAEPDHGPLASLLGEPSLLTALIDAGGVAIWASGRIATAGEVPPESTVREIVKWVASHPAEDEVVATDRLTAEAAPLADDAAARRVASGVMALRLADDDRMVLWFRPEQVRVVHWAGDPTKATDAGGRISPRKSFDKWQDAVRGRSLPWSDVDVAAAAELRSALVDVVLRHTRQLERLNAELTQSNAELDAFAYAAAHDLREPIRGVANLAAFTLEDYGDQLDETGRGYLEKIGRLSSRMDGLVTSLLRYARLGQMRLHYEPVALDGVVDDLHELFHETLASGRARLVVASPLPTVRGDPTRIAEVFQNLVGNAIKYGPEGEAVVTISAATREEALAAADTPEAQHDAARAVGEVIRICDNGIGIPVDQRREVFRIFRRLHGQDAYGGGSGAGLTIVKKAVERHGGTVWITGRNDQRPGSCFWLTLGDRRPG